MERSVLAAFRALAYGAFARAGSARVPKRGVAGRCLLGLRLTGADERGQERRRAGSESPPSLAVPRTDLTNRRKDGLKDDPQRLVVLGGQADAAEDQLQPEVVGFVRWFTS